MSLIRLVYFSRSRIEKDATGTRRELAKILAGSNQKNSACGVTGALVLHDNWFAQVLEGDRRAVNGTFERICRDERHDSVDIVEVGAVAERLFPQWSMALGRNLDVGMAMRFGTGPHFQPSEMTAEGLVRLLTEVMREEAPARVYAAQSA
jgi:hypothetical protein